jgi:hypothetical protein
MYFYLAVITENYSKSPRTMQTMEKKEFSKTQPVPELYNETYPL